jgi:hypothetical protein
VQAWQTLRDPVLVGVDVVCCLCLIAVGAAAGPAGLIQAFPFLFVAVGIVGFGLGHSWSGVLAFGALTATWTTAALQSGGLQVEPMLVSLGLWYALNFCLSHPNPGIWPG